MRKLVLLVLLAAWTPRAAAGDPVTEDPAEIDDAFPPAIVELSFESRGERLNGHMYLANGPGPHPTAVFLHGYPGNEKNLDLAQAVRRAGWNALFFHYRGAWGSEGEFRYANAMEDVASALAFIRTPREELRVDPTRLALIGHSMGGFMALMGGAKDKGVACVVGLATANMGERAQAARNAPDTLEGFKTYTDGLQMLAGFSGEIAIAEIAEAGEAYDVRRLAPEFRGRKVLLIAGERDTAVPIDVHERMVASFSEVEGVALEEARMDADHSFSWSRLALARKVTGWLNGTCLK